MTSKWGKQYFVDTFERVASTIIYGVIAMLTADSTGVVSGDPWQWWAVVGMPGALCLLKCLLVNLGGNQPTASLANVTSSGEVKN